MNIKKLIMVGVMAFEATVTFAATPTVTDVVAKQRYPWNGLVDISCKVTGIKGTAKTFWFTVGVVMPDTGNVINISASRFWIAQNGTNSTDPAVRTNGTYRLVWDASADLGQVTYDNMVVRVNLDAHDRIQLWEGGPYWATTNIGADNPEDCGLYFWWGDTIGYRRENDAWVASDGSSSNFSFDSSNTPTLGKNVATLQSEGWITADGVLTPAHDAAHVHWGGAWRMPTYQELSDLCDKCDWTRTTRNGVNGHVVRGRGTYASNSIFLPCTGRGNGTSLYDAGSSGNSWSSVPDSGYGYAWYLYFYSSDHGTSSYFRYYGRSVRPVQGFTE